MRSSPPLWRSSKRSFSRPRHQNRLVTQGAPGHFPASAIASGHKGPSAWLRRSRLLPPNALVHAQGFDLGGRLRATVRDDLLNHSQASLNPLNM